MTALTGSPLFPVPHLHVFGANHPLQARERVRAFEAATVALFVHVALFASILLAMRAGGKLPPPQTSSRSATTQQFVIPAPPSIVEDGGVRLEGVQGAGRSFDAAVAYPEPVLDILAEAPTIASIHEMFMGFNPDGVEGAGRGGPGGGGPPIDEDRVSAVLPDPFGFQDVQQPPVLVSIPKPVYPRLALEAGIRGRVQIRALVGTDGRVTEMLLITGPRVLYEEAARALRKAIFTPGLQNDHPVPVWVTVPLDFMLE